MSFKDDFLRKQQALYDLQREVWEMKKNCPHEDRIVKLVESLAFEFTPRYICPLCGEELRGDVSKEDVKRLYREEWFSFIEEREIPESELESFYNLNPRGFNPPHRKL